MPDIQHDICTNRESEMEIVKICIPQESSQYYNSNDVEIHIGEWYIVENKYGTDMGIAKWKYMLPTKKRGEPRFNVLRAATDEEQQRSAEYHILEHQAFKTCLQKIAERKLPMKLSKAKYTLDGERIIFYFTAEQQVDFRHLVKDLARTFRKRIELIQVGVRDEAGLLSGCGCCGRSLCCATFIRNFQSIAMRMAKEQNISLTPEKISGVCGRLLCCLQYENDWYVEAKRRVPQPGERVGTPRGVGIVESVNLFKEAVLVRLDRGDVVEFDLVEVRKPRLDKTTRGTRKAGQPESQQKKVYEGKV